jgi:hypothetical protein
MNQTQTKLNLYEQTVQAFTWLEDNHIDIPMDVVVGLELAHDRFDELGGVGSGFFKHKGRDAENMRGGSVKRDVASISAPANLYERDGWTGVFQGEELTKEDMEEQDKNRRVYRVTNNGQWIMDTNDDTKLLVGISGKHKGEVLLHDGYMGHGQMLSKAYGNEDLGRGGPDLDEWAHYYVRPVSLDTHYYDPNGEKAFNIGMDYAGIVLPTRIESEEDPDYQKVLDNIGYSIKVLKKLGVPEDALVFIRGVPIMEGHDRMPIVEKVGNFDAWLDAFYELGGVGSGFKGHKGRDAENLRGGSVARGVSQSEPEWLAKWKKEHDWKYHLKVVKNFASVPKNWDINRAYWILPNNKILYSESPYSAYHTQMIAEYVIEHPDDFQNDEKLIRKAMDTYVTRDMENDNMENIGFDLGWTKVRISRQLPPQGLKWEASLEIGMGAPLLGVRTVLDTASERENKAKKLIKRYDEKGLFPDYKYVTVYGDRQEKNKEILNVKVEDIWNMSSPVVSILPRKPMTEQENKLKNYLEQMRQFKARQDELVDWKYRSHEELVLREGRWCEVSQQPLPVGVYYGQVSKPFANAAELALTHPDEYTYVEGYAMTELIGGMPF